MAAVVGPSKLLSPTLSHFGSLPGCGVPLASPFLEQEQDDL